MGNMGGCSWRKVPTASCRKRYLRRRSSKSSRSCYSSRRSRRRRSSLRLSISKLCGLRHYFVVALAVAIFHLSPCPFFEKQEEVQLQLLHEEEIQHKEAAMYKAPVENDMRSMEVHDEIPAELAVEGVDDMLIDPPAPEATMPHPAGTGTRRTRRPCFGWISESESDSGNEEHEAT